MADSAAPQAKVGVPPVKHHPHVKARPYSVEGARDRPFRRQRLLLAGETVRAESSGEGGTGVRSGSPSCPPPPGLSRHPDRHSRADRALAMPSCVGISSTCSATSRTLPARASSYEQRWSHFLEQKVEDLAKAPAISRCSARTMAGAGEGVSPTAIARPPNGFWTRSPRGLSVPSRSRPSRRRVTWVTPRNCEILSDDDQWIEPAPARTAEIYVEPDRQDEEIRGFTPPRLGATHGTARAPSL